MNTYYKHSYKMNREKWKAKKNINTKWSKIEVIFWSLDGMDSSVCLLVLLTRTQLIAALFGSNNQRNCKYLREHLILYSPTIFVFPSQKLTIAFLLFLLPPLFPTQQPTYISLSPVFNFHGFSEQSLPKKNMTQLHCGAPSSKCRGHPTFLLSDCLNLGLQICYITLDFMG